MPFTVNKNVVEHWEKEMPGQYWARHKKANINLTTDGPFNLDRQFADQWELIERNRNPQYFKDMKPDKPLSEVKFMKRGKPSDLSIKAKVLNKTVREASGTHQYAMVAPIRSKAEREEDKKKPFDADMDPLTAPYRREANQKPAMVNFGHRPSSANRTFHPATMKMKLKHGEIVRTEKGDEEKSTFGLPVAILKTVIKAPRLYRPSEMEEKLDNEYQQMLAEKEATRGNMSSQGSDGGDPMGLFTLPAESMSPGKGDDGAPSLSGSWVSDANESEFQGGASRSGLGETPRLTAGSSGTRRSRRSGTTAKTKGRWKPGKELIRDDWDEGFHNIRRHPNETFKLKASGLLEGEKMPLKERMTRFNKKSASTGPQDGEENHLGMDKINTDRLIALGKPVPLPKGRIPLEENPYFDPESEALVHHLKREARREQALLKKKNDDYHIMLMELEVPDVSYAPDLLADDLANGREKKVLKQVRRRSEATSFHNPLDTGFKVASVAEATETFFARKRYEAGDSLSRPRDAKKGSFDPGLEFTDRGFGPGGTGARAGGGDGSVVTTLTHTPSTGALANPRSTASGKTAADDAEHARLEARVNKMLQESPFGTAEYVPAKKVVVKRKVDPVEQKMKDALRRAAKDDDDKLFKEFMGADALDDIVREKSEQEEKERREAEVHDALHNPKPSLARLASGPLEMTDVSIISKLSMDPSLDMGAVNPTSTADGEDEVSMSLFSETDSLFKKDDTKKAGSREVKK